MAEKGDQGKAPLSGDKDKKEDDEDRLHFLSSQSESIIIDASTDDDPDAKYFRQMATEFPLPWDEIQLHEHGLLDSKCHHVIVPQDEIRLHRTGLIDDKGQTLGPRNPPRHYPFDELALKYSGYVDSRCQHRTVSDLEKQRRKNVDDKLDPQMKTADEKEVKSKISTAKLKPVKMNIQGHLNVRQTNVSGQTPPKKTTITVAGNVKSHLIRND